MKKSINLSKIAIHIDTKMLLHELPYYVLFLGVLIFTVYYTFQTFETYSAYQNQRNSNNDLKDKLSLLQSSTELNENDINLFNEVTSKLVPEDENYFALVNTIETLSSKTGFQLYNYNIDLTTSTPEKLSISVSGKGDNDSFFKFLQQYKYASGRLITIESINYMPNSVQEYSFVLNFYHKKQEQPSEPQVMTGLPSLNLVNEIIGAAPQLTEQDINFVRELLVETGSN